MSNVEVLVQKPLTFVLLDRIPVYYFILFYYYFFIVRSNSSLRINLFLVFAVTEIEHQVVAKINHTLWSMKHLRGIPGSAQVRLK